MIIGLGSDIVDIRRIEKLMRKFGLRFEQRIFTMEELAVAKRIKDEKKYYSHLAKRFAAKEAAAKALGTGIGGNIAFTDAAVSNLPSGKPTLALSGNAAVTLKSLIPENMISQIDISLSDDYPIAQAIVIITANC